MITTKVLGKFASISETASSIDLVRRWVRDAAISGRLLTGVPMPWVTVGNVASTRLGKMLDKGKNRGVPGRYLRNLNVRWDDFDLTDVLEMPFEPDEVAELALRVGDVLVCEGGEPGRAAVWDGREPGMLFQKAVHRVRFTAPVSPRYFTLVLRQASESGRIYEFVTGTTFKHLTGAGLKRFSFPLPDLEAQDGIVSVVDALLDECKLLEASQRRLDETRDRLRVATLARLTAPTEAAGKMDPKDVAFFLAHSDRMLQKPEHVGDLRRAIFDLAVQQKLVQSAGTLTAGTLGDICQKITDGTHRTPTYVPSGVHFVSVKDFSAGKLDLSSTRYITAEEHAELIKRCDPRRGDVLIGRIGTLGKAVVVDTDTPFSLFVSAGLLRPTLQRCLPEYMALYLNSPTAEAQYDRIKVGGGTHTNKLNLGDLKRFRMPVPSIATQETILARVGELMAVCDELEQALRSAEEGRAQLLKAVLDEALNGRVVGAELAEATA